MKKVTLCFEFRGGKGHAYVSVIPSKFGIEKVSESGCLEYSLPSPGEYDFLFEGVSPAGGTTVTIEVDDEVVGTKKITKAGFYSRDFLITI